MEGEEQAHRRVVVFSQREASRKVWQASQYEFEDVVAAVEDARVIAPPGTPVTPVARARRMAENALRTGLRRPRLAAMQPTRMDDEADLFFAVFASGHDLAYLPRLQGWQERSRHKVAFVVEWWTTQASSTRDCMRLLKDFDQVFVFSRGILPHLRATAGVPCDYLAGAVDLDVFSPPTPAPARTIDVNSYGRTLPETHQALVRALEARRLHYVHSTTAGPFAFAAHREHRLQTAAALQRSRYTVVYRNNESPARALLSAGEESLTFRYFEGIAAGAVVLGTRPEAPDFTDCFDWPDAVIPIGAPEPDIESVIAALDADPERLARARLDNVTQSLRRHDWGHRWRTVLASVGLEPTPQLQARLGRLAARADALEASSPAPPPG